MVATASFVCLPPTHGGRGGWVDNILGVVAVVMTRRERELPRRVVLSVSDVRVEVHDRGGRELASWPKTHVRASAEATGRHWDVWVQPPGDRAGFELRGAVGPATDAVVRALSAGS